MEFNSSVMDYSSRVPYNTFDVTEMLNGTGKTHSASGWATVFTIKTRPIREN